MREKEDDEIIVGAPLLFETKEARFRGAYKLFASTILVSISLILFYRVTNFPTATRTESWAWIVMLVSEILFGLYWIITQSVRWRIAFQSPSKHTLLQRYDEEKMPGVDIFVCTADPKLEPPLMVINTILSAMAYNYPSNKLSVYLSDDGGSELTFYALFKASIFSKHWLPFCRKFNLQTRSPHAFFSPLNHNYHSHHHDHDDFHKQWLFIKKLYEEMKSDIETTLAKGKVADGERNFHKGFKEWSSKTKKQDHQSIVQIIIDGRDKNAVDEEGIQLPRVVYMAREKRPNYPHHFKAGAMNALIRVSSEISNGPLILNLDCDMYPSNADTIQETLCFFMDESRGQNIAYVQFPQNYNNLTNNDHYASSCLATDMIELAGISGHGAALYCGTGCFHRRESLSGSHFRDYKAKLDHMIMNTKIEDNRTVDELNEASKLLATCTYEHGTLWGKEPTSLWFLPFAYAFVANNVYSLCEALSCGSTIKSWLNLQRMRFIRRTTSYFFGFIDTITKQLGLSQTNFVVTDKVVTEDVQKRYEKEIIDFGGCSSIMLTMLVTLALLNLLGLLVGIRRIIMGQLIMIIQIVISAMIVMVNLPVYEALFIRSDKGSISSNVMIKSFVLASMACFIATFVL
ncbi:cellulose synthase-like protein E6 isoform X4 [Arachis hypogaea]|uniref:cellulose synthase-like protein E6 isoform X4 n=1 Tax=Arachis hypogaea TaxID=3818 RepID=UPI000DED8A26